MFHESAPRILRPVSWMITLVVVLGCASPVLTPTASAPPPAPSTPTSPSAAQKDTTPAQLLNGPVIGAVTDTTARVFVQTTKRATVQLQYSTAADLKQAATTEPFEMADEPNPTTQIELRDLQPNTRYTLNVLVNGKPHFEQPYPTFKTFVPEGQAADFSLVILTDFGWRPTGTFRNAANEDPDFVVIGGDFGHSIPKTLAKKRGLFMNHYDRAKLPDFVNLILDRYGVAHFWDDHDFGKNNSDKTYPDKKMSLDVLKQFFPVYPVTAHGDWQLFSYGNADFFMLDSRSQRDPSNEPDDETKSMLDGDNLGAAGQYEWLTQGLKNSRATWKFILTPVPFNPTVPKDDAWGSYVSERKKLVEWIRTNNIRGVVMLSGDLHAGALDDGANSDFPEMLVPATNSNACLTTKKPGTWSEGVYARPAREVCDGYGVVRVLTNPDRAQLIVKNDRGEELFSLEVTP